MTKELTLEENSIVQSNSLKEIQENFLTSKLGQIINNAIDIGLKSILPDLIEDEIINIKDTVLENGLKSGIKEAIDTAINLGKGTIGIFTGNFENVSQMEMVIKKGGILDCISNVLDNALKNAQQNGKIDKAIVNLIKDGKNEILKNIETKIENTFSEQVKNVEKLQDYCTKWKEAFENQNFEDMTKYFKNVEKYLNKTIPLENTIKEARKIENLQNLIKNNGHNFNISENEIKLAEKLSY